MSSGHRPLGHVETQVLEDDDRAVVEDGLEQEALRVVGRRRHDRLQPGMCVYTE